ncbi:DnaD domain protein [Saccharibacillus brassicae]|uniref:DnaD domain protein n=1 Tax=Saccharibacillus brassicae TaxID=2583377 RepID=A0A4Y6V296_SACBS|nr:DnaD domain protein [Saccharibacillus brassicae]QDH23494.1 hypothetical protein FFV09_23090 [Saccharibacillus brassicae]
MADEIYRITKQENYVVMDRRFLHNNKLSLKAKGLLAYVLTLPDDWKFHIEELAKHSTDGEKGLRSGWKELIENGYVNRVPIREGQRIAYWETQVFEHPSLNPLHSENRQIENPLLSGSVHVQKLHVDPVHVQDRRLLSIDLLPSIDSTNSSSTSEPVKPDGLEEETVSDVYTQVFGTFAMTPLFTGFVKELKRKGRTDRFVIELLLEAGESSSGKPTLKFVRAIADRWLQEGIESREQAATKKSAGYSPARQPPKSSGWRPSKPDLPIVQNDPEQSGVSDEEFAEYVRLAEEMKESKGAGPRAGDEE